MELSVKNLGAIHNGKISFDKDFIVITGPNNTGKSYLTYLMHAIHNLNTFVEETNSYALFDNLFDNKNIVKELIKENTINLTSILLNYGEEISAILTKIVENNFVKIFASKSISPTIKISLESFNLDNIPAPTIIGYKIIKKGMYTMWADKTINDEPIKNKEATPAYVSALIKVILTMYLQDNSPFGKSYIFPSERTSINLFAKDIIAKKAGARDEMALRVLAGEDINDIARSITQEQNTNPKYPLAINDYINFVFNFDGSEEISELSYLADELEASVMDGRISLSEFKTVVFQPNNTQQQLNLHESSSLVKSLSFLVIYLRHFASKGDWIIIDEPEINLHPNRQVAIAKLFVRMVNSGLKLIVSTHSDYLIKELNNLILLNDLQASEGGRVFIEQKGYLPDQLLDKARVGAYFLDDNSIKHINVETSGIEVPSINETINAIDSLTEEILYQM